MGGLVLAAWLLSSAPGPRHIEDPARGFSFMVPGDYDEMPGRHSAGAWVRHPEEDDFVMIALEGMKSTITQGELELGRPSDTRFAEKWKGFDLDGMRVVEEREGERILVLVVQVPLAPQALEVMTSGLELNEPAVRQAMRALLDSLEGRSSWVTEEERAAANTQGALRLGVTFLLIAGLGLGAWQLRRRRRRGYTWAACERSSFSAWWLRLLWRRTCPVRGAATWVAGTVTCPRTRRSRAGST